MLAHAAARRRGRLRLNNYDAEAKWQFSRFDLLSLRAEGAKVGREITGRRPDYLATWASGYRDLSRQLELHLPFRMPPPPPPPTPPHTHTPTRRPPNTPPFSLPCGRGEGRITREESGPPATRGFPKNPKEASEADLIAREMRNDIRAADTRAPRGRSKGGYRQNGIRRSPKSKMRTPRGTPSPTAEQLATYVARTRFQPSNQ